MYSSSTELIVSCSTA